MKYVKELGCKVSRVAELLTMLNVRGVSVETILTEMEIGMENLAQIVTRARVGGVRVRCNNGNGPSCKAPLNMDTRTLSLSQKNLCKLLGLWGIA